MHCLGAQRLRRGHRGPLKGLPQELIAVGVRPDIDHENVAVGEGRGRALGRGRVLHVPVQLEAVQHERTGALVVASGIENNLRHRAMASSQGRGVGGGGVGGRRVLKGKRKLPPGLRSVDWLPLYGGGRWAVGG